MGDEITYLFAFWNGEVISSPLLNIADSVLTAQVEYYAPRLMTS